MKSLIWLLVGAAVGATIVTLLSQTSDSSAASNPPQEKESQPLYWVAPMDPNYRRAEPGKSPMGMDLIPVYEETDADVITVSPGLSQTIGITTAEARRGIFRQSVKVPGQVKFDENAIYHLHPRVEGWIDRLHVSARGERVAKGQPLYSLYSPELTNAQEEFLLAMRNGSNTLKQATKQRLLALSMPESALQHLERTKHIQSSVTVNSPIDGILEMLPIREGFYVKPDSTVMSVASLDTIWAEFAIPLHFASKVHVGQHINLSDANQPAMKWRGQIDYLYPTADKQTQTLTARVVINNDNHVLKPNGFLVGDIQVSDEDSQLLVPTSAVIRDGHDNRIVVRDSPGRYRVVSVDIGQVTSELTVIRDGLEEGQTVVTSGQFLLDSESNVAAGMRQLNQQPHDDQQHNTATVSGKIVAIDQGVFTIDRAAVSKWNRGPARVDFTASPELFLPHLQVGDHILFTFSVDQGQFEIVDLIKLRAPHNQAKTEVMTHDH